MTDPISREEIASKLDAVEARSQAKFAEIMGEIKASHAHISGQIATAQAKALDRWTAIGIAVGMAALIFAILAYGGDLFGMGVSTGEVAEKAAREAVVAYQAAERAG